MVASPSDTTSLIHVRGAGPTGSLLALALAQQGRCVLLEDPLTATELQSRSRAYAITHSSRRLLQRLDLWSALDDALVPFTRLDLRDAGSGGRVLFGQQDLRKRNRRHQAIGWILDHRPLMRLLLDRLQQSPRVTLGLGEFQSRWTGPQRHSSSPRMVRCLPPGSLWASTCFSTVTGRAA